MLIANLQVNNIRSIAQAGFQPKAGVNLIYGKNGSGKTSLMEAIALLGYSRSFLPCQTKELVRFGQQQLQVFAQVETVSEKQKSFDKLGFGYHLKDGKKLRLNEEKARSEDVVRHLPLAVLSPKSFDILEGPANERRKRVDWGAFHVKHGFREEWQKYRKLLLQRNASLKQATRSEEISHWTNALVESAERVTQIRREHVQEMLPFLHSRLKRLGFSKNLVVEEDVGWSSTSSFAAQIEQGFDSDKRLGSTQKGAHRYDLRFLVEGHKAKNVLSRGEKKRVLCALLFAQIECLRASGKISVAILDDVSSEFDQDAISALVEEVADLCDQTFVTVVDSPLLSGLSRAGGVFHVEQGVLTEE